MKGKIGLQLYSLKDIINESSLVDILKKVKEIGYEGIEGVERDGDPDTVHLFCNKKPSEIRAILEEVGLRAVSNHISLEDLKKDVEKTVRYYKEIGCDTLVIAGIPGRLFKDRDTVRSTVKEMSEISVKLAAHGMEFAFHNCPFTFVGKECYELFAQEIGDTLALQPDAGNTCIAGVEPVKYFKKLHNRFVSMHVKDGRRAGNDMLPLDGGKEGKGNETIWERFAALSTNVGNGDANLKKFVRLGEKRDVSWFIIEEEVTGDPLKTVEEAYRYLVSL